jgi:hypothetical protein
VSPGAAAASAAAMVGWSPGTRIVRPEASAAWAAAAGAPATVFPSVLAPQADTATSIENAHITDAIRFILAPAFR